MSRDLRDRRVQFMISDPEIKAIDDWRFANRCTTQADAIRKLIKIGLAAQADEKTAEVRRNQ